MTDLTEEALEDAIRQIKKFTNQRLAIQPTKIIVPGEVREYCDSLGVTPQELYQAIIEGTNYD